MRALIVMAILGFVTSYASAEDCELGKRYMALAQDHVKKFANEEAVAFLRKSVETCPTYEAYQQLGELAAQSSEQEQRAQAAEAFVNAYELARSDQERANTLYQYALLAECRRGSPECLSVDQDGRNPRCSRMRISSSSKSNWMIRFGIPRRNNCGRALRATFIVLFDLLPPKTQPNLLPSLCQSARRRPVLAQSISRSTS